MSKQKRSPLARLAGALAKWLGSGVVATGALLPGPAPTQAAAYRSLEGAPAAWLNYASLVQRRVQDWLGQDDEPGRRLRASLEARSQQQGATPSFIARLWILANGKIERADFEGIDVAEAVALRALFAGRDVGEPPPADMSQPLHLKLSLRGQN